MATIEKTAFVGANARVSGSAWVDDLAHVYGSAVVSGSAVVDGHAKINGSKEWPLYTGILTFPWTAFREQLLTATVVEVFRYGCERHPLKKWTAKFVEELCKKHKQDLSHEILATVAYVKKLFHGGFAT